MGFFICITLYNIHIKSLIFKNFLIAIKLKISLRVYSHNLNKSRYPTAIKKYFMKLRKTLIGFTLLASFSVLAFTSCNKENSTNSNDKAHLQVALTDDPGDYDAVYIDLQDVRINYSTDTSSGWISMPNVKRGSYNLLDLVNDKDTLLTDADIQAGKIEQIRLVLGSNNYVIVDGKKEMLNTPSAQQSGLKINIHQQLNEGIAYKLLLDFDVAKSVHQTGNGKYMLKPTIRAVMQAQGGSIRGFVLPDSIRTSVIAIQGTDTIASTYTSNGGYMLKGLDAGTYNLHFLPDSIYANQVKTGVVVTNNTLTTVDTLRLQK